MKSLVESIKSTWSSSDVPLKATRRIFDESLLTKRTEIKSLDSDAIRNAIFGNPGERLSNFGHPTLYKNDTADLWDYEISGKVLTCIRNKIEDNDEFKINTEIATRIKNLDIDKVAFTQSNHSGITELVFDWYKPNNLQGLEFDFNLKKLSRLGIDAGSSSYDNFKLTANEKVLQVWNPDMKNIRNLEITCPDFELIAEFWKYISNKTRFVIDSPIIRCGNLRTLVTKLRKSHGLFDEKWLPAVEKFKESPVDLVKLLGLDFMELKNLNTILRFTVVRNSSNILFYEITPFDKRLAQDFHIKLANGLYLDMWYKDLSGRFR